MPDAVFDQLRDPYLVRLRSRSDRWTGEQPAPVLGLAWSRGPAGPAGDGTGGAGGLEDDIGVHFLPISNRWVWQIPIRAKSPASGSSRRRRTLQPARRGKNSIGLVFGSRPELLTLCAKRIVFDPSRKRATTATHEPNGRRPPCLIGDAGRFVDPIFSTGVSIALTCSRFAHTNIVKALETGNFKRRVVLDLRRDPPAGYAELVQVHLRVLPAQHGLHRVRHGSAISAGPSSCSKATSMTTSRPKCCRSCSGCVGRMSKPIRITSGTRCSTN